MVNPAGDFPDFTRAILLMARDPSGDLIPILVDANGNLYALFKGETALGALHNIRIDTDGQLVIVPRGESGNYMDVDVNGFLTAVLKGAEGGGALHTIMVDASGQLVTVPRGASGNYMDVDVNGYLTAVLKGELDGSLYTASVDASGRLQAFILDSESQWGDVLKVGNSELAARLGGIKTWDWRGQVLFQNDFSKGMGNVLRYPSGTGSSITFDPSYWQTGGYALKLVAGSDSDHDAALEFLVESPPSLRIGLEVAWSYVLNFQYLWIQLRRYVGGVIYYADWRYDGVNYRLEMRHPTGSWVQYGNPYFLAGPEQFHRMKVVADFDAKTYVRALDADHEWTLSQYDLYHVGTGFLSTIYCRVDWIGRPGYNDVGYLDSVIVTVGE